jgi:uncharacterized protein involved in exopolysaccharide biosynthesis
MIDSWLMSAERIAHLATVSGASTIGVISIDGDAGASTLSRQICHVLSGGTSKGLLVDLGGSVLNATGTTDSGESAPVWERKEAGEEGYAEMVARPTTATRFIFNDVASLQRIWRDELGSHAKLVVDLPPALHARDDLLSPLAAAASCDAVFLVCLQGRTAGPRLAEAVALLRAARVKVSGVIVNGRDYPADEIAAQPAPAAIARDVPEAPVGHGLLRAAWRRRYLLLVPILVMLPLSIIVAKKLPVPYVAKALLLLQEPGIESPAGTAFAVSERIEERAPGLELLLKSDRVLAPAIADLQQAGLVPPDAEDATDDFRDRLSLRLVGLDILEIELQGNTQQGLGRQLGEIVTRFLAVLTTDQGAMTAGQLLVEDSLSAWRAAEQNHSVAVARLSALFPKGLQDASAKIGLIDERLKSKQAELAAITEELQRSTSQTQTPPPQAEGKQDRLVKEIAEVEAERRRLEGLITEYRRLEDEIPSLDADVAAAQQTYATFSEQYASGAAEFPQRLLDAPERIRIIEPPGDPKSPETSRLLYVLFGVAASMVLGVGLAWGAEQIDPSLRDGQDFLAAAGIPVVAYLPRFESAAAPRRHRSLRWFALLLFILALSALWLWLAPSETTASFTAPLSELLATIRSWLAGVTDSASESLP